MANTKTAYFCTNCGEVTTKWFGQCPSCNEWDTLEEETVIIPSGKTSKANNIFEVNSHTLSQISVSDEDRFSCGIKELDRVLGGGIVRGSVVLIGGEPGAGKSTLLLQVCGSISKNLNVIYFSGEESLRQIKLRADRLEVIGSNIEIANETNIETIVSTIARLKPDLVIIDSIQTMNYNSLPSSPGSVTQVRECASLLLNTAKDIGTSILMIGHVNKEGAIAGPKVMEHIVDAVLYFEGDKLLSHRILRSSKNRYGSTNEIGLFEMTGNGLQVILNPSAALLEGRESDISGSCVTCIMEGTRPILSEVQSLVTKTSFSAPRRTTTGFDYNRVSLLIAVLEKRAGYFLSNLDVYINVVGGLEIDEPAADLAVALSMVSSTINKHLPYDCVAFGEIGLGGEIRSVRNPETRLIEALNLGFKKCFMPSSNIENLSQDYGIKLIPAKSVKDIASLFVD